MRLGLKSSRLFLLWFAIVTTMTTLGFSENAFAQATGGGGTGRYEAYMSAGDLGISKSATEIDISPGFEFVPVSTVPWFQFGAEISYQKVSYMDSASTNFLFLLGPTFNIGPTIPDSFFISLGIADRTGSAAVPDNSTVDPNGFGFYFFAGKRFPISGALSLRPSLGVVSCGTSGMVFRPFALSYTF